MSVEIFYHFIQQQTLSTYRMNELTFLYKTNNQTRVKYRKKLSYADFDKEELLTCLLVSIFFKSSIADLANALAN